MNWTAQVLDVDTCFRGHCSHSVQPDTQVAVAAAVAVASSAEESLCW